MGRTAQRHGGVAVGDAIRACAGVGTARSLWWLMRGGIMHRRGDRATSKLSSCHAMIPGFKVMI
eukprot:365121-Chlamydomonas_euryale.AAC.10